MLAASLSYKVFQNDVKCAITKVEIGEISSLTEPQSRSLFNFLCGNDTFVSLPAGHGKSLIRHPLHSDGTLSTSQIIFSTKLSNLLHDDLIFLFQGLDPLPGVENILKFFENHISAMSRANIVVSNFKI